MGAEAIKGLLQDFDIEAEAEFLRETSARQGQRKRPRRIKRLKVVSAFLRRHAATRRWAWCSTPSR